MHTDRQIDKLIDRQTDRKICTHECPVTKLHQTAAANNKLM